MRRYGSLININPSGVCVCLVSFKNAMSLVLRATKIRRLQQSGKKEKKTKRVFTDKSLKAFFTFYLLLTT